VHELRHVIEQYARDLREIVESEGVTASGGRTSGFL
jgi:hypothetical protein